MNPKVAGFLRIPSDALTSEVRKALKVKWRDSSGDPRSLQMWCVDEQGDVLVPRDYGFIKYPDTYYEYSMGEEIPYQIDSIDLRPEQEPWVEQICRWFQTKNDVIAKAGVGKGKCLGVDTPVLMYDGRIKAVQDIEPGDILMGPDSKPRNVQSTTVGTGPLYRITPNKGDSFVCNDEHILSLKRTARGPNDKNKGRLLNISVTDYLSSTKHIKRHHKLWRTGVSFKEAEVPYDPYIIGLYLGDGASHNCNITVAHTEPEIYDAVYGFAQSIGLHIKEDAGRGCDTLNLHTGVRFNGVNKFRDYVLYDLHDFRGRKRIPKEYCVNTEQNRLQVLAGLMDSDGSLHANCYDLITKYAGLAEDIVYLAKSLGFFASMSACSKSCGDFTGSYFRVIISGHIDRIPCKVAHKKANPRKQKKDVLVTGFTVEYIGDGNYYGFEIDSDRLFMLGDFTVTHNTVMALEVARRMGRIPLVLVDQDFLKTQWIERAVQFWGISEDDVGVIQGPNCDYEGKSIVIGMVQSLYQKDYPEEIYSYFGLVILDEVHTLGAPVFSKVLGQFNARWRLGVSATPDREDVLNRVLRAHLGPVRVVMEQLHDVSQVRILTYKEGSPSWYATITKKQGRFISEIAEDTDRNLIWAEAIIYMWRRGRQILVIGDRIIQLHTLLEMAVALGVRREDCGIVSTKEHHWGYLKDPNPQLLPIGWDRESEYTPVVLGVCAKSIPKEVRQSRKEHRQIIFTTYSIFAKGVDVPRLDVGMDVTPRSKSEQVHGRILRSQEGKNMPIWVTMRDTVSYRCEFQLSKRLLDYMTNNAEAYLWRFGKGIKLVNARELQKKIAQRASYLKEARILTRKDGRNIVLIPHTETPLNAVHSNPTVETTRKKRARYRKGSA